MVRFTQTPPILCKQYFSFNYFPIKISFCKNAPFIIADISCRGFIFKLKIGGDIFYLASMISRAVKNRFLHQSLPLAEPDQMGILTALNSPKILIDLSSFWDNFQWKYSPNSRNLLSFLREILVCTIKIDPNQGQNLENFRPLISRLHKIGGV